MVQVGDLDGVPVSLSNQVVSTTNSRGLALVTGLLPYQLNKLSLNARSASRSTCRFAACSKVWFLMRAAAPW